MKNLLVKEFRLATPMLTYLFLGFAAMTFIPGYPILCGAFFICMGIFQGYQINKDSNDILYSVLLPVRKTDVVKAKYLAVILLQMTAFLLCTIFTIIRMTVLSDAAVYKTNVLMGANFIYLAYVLLIFASFNVIFLGSFFQTAYKIGKPFLTFLPVNFIIIGVGETLHHLPGLSFLNTLDFSFLKEQMIIFAFGIGVYVFLTVISCKMACLRFEKLDL